MTATVPYALASRNDHPHDSVVRVGGVPVGGRRFTVIAGPCAVEGPEGRDLLASHGVAAGQLLEGDRPDAGRDGPAERGLGKSNSGGCILAVGG